MSKVRDIIKNDKKKQSWSIWFRSFQESLLGKLNTGLSASRSVRCSYEYLLTIFIFTHYSCRYTWHQDILVG